MPRFFTLSSGRILEWDEFGDPQGFPVIYFHGHLGSLHQASIGHRDAMEAGIRIIAPSRPGVGRSTPHAYRTMVEHVEDVLELLKALHTKEFVAFGLSCGAGFALACAARAPKQTRFVVLASPLPPLNEEGYLPRMDLIRRTILSTAFRHPRLLATALSMYRVLLFKFPRFFLWMASIARQPLDASAKRKKEIRRALLREVRDVFGSRTSPGSVVADLRLSFSWGFDLSSVARPVVLWHGTADTIVPLASANDLFRLLPSAECHIVEGDHFIMLRVLPDVVREVAERLLLKAKSPTAQNPVPEDARETHLLFPALPA